jgi:hypothetical protein
MSIFTIGVSVVLVTVLMLPETEGRSSQSQSFAIRQHSDQGRDQQRDPRRYCSNGHMACGGNGLTGSSYPAVVHPRRPGAAS